MCQSLTYNQKKFLIGLPVIFGTILLASYSLYNNQLLFLSGIILFSAHIILGFIFHFKLSLEVLIKAVIFGSIIFLVFHSIFSIVIKTHFEIWIYLALALIAWTIFLTIISQYDVHFFRAFNQKGLITIKNWTARVTQREQGTDTNEIILNGGNIKQLSFRIETKSEYWRAGFKLCDANQSDLPLRGPDSLLFHVGANQSNGFIGIAGYVDGYKKEVHKILSFKNTEIPIDMHFEINDKNWFKCMVNNSSQFEGRVDPKILKKAFLLAWGDGYNYEVDFKNIGYQKK